MSELNEKVRLISWFDLVIQYFQSRLRTLDEEWDMKDKENAQAIRRLIENRPRITREFVATLAGELSTYNFQKKHPNEVFDLLLKRFKEAGIEIEGEEKEA